MGEAEDIIKNLITGSPKRRGRVKTSGGLLGLPSLPDPAGIRESVEGVKESIEQVIEGITGLKDIPKTLLEGITEADEDFRSADKEFRSTRIRGPRTRGSRKK